jgi:hypothetical protein
MSILLWDGSIFMQNYKNEFYEIFKNCDTDKAQNYSTAYFETIGDIRQDIKLLFEIGVCRGGSARGFRKYFPNAVIVGIDIDPNSYFEEPGINIEIGDAANEQFINSLIDKYGLPDIVIDDGSHFSSDIKKSFQLLYDKTKTCYVIEDYGTQFFEFRNGFYINDGQPATNILTDHVNSLLFKPGFCKAIHIYHSICFIMK